MLCSPKDMCMMYSACRRPRSPSYWIPSGTISSRFPGTHDKTPLYISPTYDVHTIVEHPNQEGDT